MHEDRIRFSRSESWTAGWRGKQSVVEITLDGDREVGEIRGSEGAFSQMEYEVRWHHSAEIASADSQRAAKEAATENARRYRFFISEAPDARWKVYDALSMSDYATHLSKEAAIEHASALERQASCEEARKQV